MENISSPEQQAKLLREACGANLSGYSDAEIAEFFQQWRPPTEAMEMIAALFARDFCSYFEVRRSPPS